MEWWGYLIIAIILIIGLVILFIVSFYFNKKTPVPKGCEDIIIGDKNCSSCPNIDCDIKNKYKKEK